MHYIKALKFVQNLSMITYEKFWVLMKQKNISQYKLNKEYGIDHRLLDSLRNNKDMKLSTVNSICNKLGIKPEEMIDYKED